MKNNGKKMLIAAAVLGFCIVLSSSSTSIQGRGKTYEIRPEISLPAYQNDTTRFIESYERILQRLITTNERSQFNLSEDVGDVDKKLESMDKKLDDIIARLKKIEKALNIDEKPTLSTDNNIDHQDNEADDD